MEYEKLIRERFSTRKFKDDMVSDELITKILEAGNVAPTAKNNQPQKIYVVKSSDGIEKIDKITKCRYNAPVVLIIASDMMLEATNLGVDNIWIELFDKNMLKKEFDIPDNIEPICLMPLGYRTDDYLPSPLHSMRKDLKEIVEYK